VKKPAEPVAEKKSEPAKADAGAKPAEAKPKYKPLAEVKDEIRRILARKKADERVMAAMAPIESRMKKFRGELILYKSAGDAEKGPAPQFDLAAVAKAANMTFHQVGPSPDLEIAQLDIGKSLVDAQQPFVRVIFEGLSERQPGISQDLDQNYYLFWKTAGSDDQVPSFEDKGVRDQVLAAWKMVEARKLALAEAERLAGEARKGKGFLETTIGRLPGVVVSRDGPFSWMTTGNVPSMINRTPPRISQVEHVEMAGDEFMREVYRLAVGEIGVAMNHPKTIAYVVQPTETTPSENVLWQMFTGDNYAKYSLAGWGDLQSTYAAWSDQLHKAAGLEWARDPDRRRASSDEL
jgi:hypothetical protein